MPLKNISCDRYILSNDVFFAKTLAKRWIKFLVLKIVSTDVLRKWPSEDYETAGCVTIRQSFYLESRAHQKHRRCTLAIMLIWERLPDRNEVYINFAGDVTWVIWMISSEEKSFGISFTDSRCINKGWLCDCAVYAYITSPKPTFVFPSFAQQPLTLFHSSRDIWWLALLRRCGQEILITQLW